MLFLWYFGFFKRLPLFFVIGCKRKRTKFLTKKGKGDILKGQYIGTVAFLHTLVLIACSFDFNFLEEVTK